MTRWGVWDCKYFLGEGNIDKEGVRCNWQYNKKSRKGILCLGSDVGAEEASKMRGTRVIETDILCFVRKILDDLCPENETGRVFREAAASREGALVEKCVSCKGYDGECSCYSPSSKTKGEEK